MKNKKHPYFLIGIAAFILTTFTGFGQEKAKDYLSAGEKIAFNAENYNLKWSSNPSANYYKQEYLRTADVFPNYQKMIILEIIKGNLTASQAAGGKINELENWKKSNPMVRYEKFENKDKNEITLDFVVSDGKSIYEWNVYRYQEQKNPSGNYLVLYCYSYRNYISEKVSVNQFLDFVTKTRMETINTIRRTAIPKVKTN
ncbi:MAG: hypothetical protein GZ087_06645 [Flavobacterium sp.]|nr:hypothetical protein [Flavobacterium sp.]